jgi:uncharacterized membrane protein
VDDPRLPRFIYAFLLLTGITMAAYYHPQMPSRMASHFAADGRANGWQSREGFFLVMLLVTGLSGVVGSLVPRQIAAQSNSRINLPNKSYWLAPERRAETFRFLSTMMAWFSCGLLFVVISGTFLALRANLSEDGRFQSEAMLAVLAAFLLFVALWFLRMFRHFRQVPPSF